MAATRKATPDPTERAAAIAAKLPPLPLPGPAASAPPAVKRGVYVFLADDEPDEATFNARLFKIQPGSTEIVSPWKDVKARTIAEHIAEKLGMWGVCVTSGPVTGGKAAVAEDQPAVDAAQAQYLRRTYGWASDAIRESYEKNQPFVAAGLAPKLSDEAVKARAWLKARDSDLRAAGLIA